ncbi:hypothetical protein [Phaeobacter gallaeciensis]|nr:hypothetical protein [Phaeobacter gallaeciensis]MDE4059755.1 hypothetical protein [Phaeobacter gallaeciensis]MDE4122608.1 hypothetical protein [Phaeobacter gallaeciensis]MDE4127242.1 hypothetical protein [Phaeobacter gallaeciensis]
MKEPYSTNATRNRIAQNIEMMMKIWVIAGTGAMAVHIPAKLLGAY